MPHEEQIPSDVIVQFQKNGWMDVDLMKRYIEYLNDIQTNNKSSKVLTMMVYDSFSEHLEESIKKDFSNSGIDLAIIPDGLTSICQPLDVAINKLFKDNLRKEWHFWMANSDAGQTVKGNLQCAKLSDICGWVKESWNNISDNIIINSFKTCGISNPINENINEEFD